MCGVIAVVNSDNAADLVYYGLHALQHRGQQASGLVVFDGENVNVVKNEGLIIDVIKEERLKTLHGNICLGHVRYATAGGLGLNNVQPFVCKFHDESIALVHNGHIVNSQLLRKKLESEGSVFACDSDSEILFHLVRNEKGDFKQRLINSLNKIDGSFAYILNRNNIIYGIRDKNGLRPLSLCINQDGSYVLASETSAFNVIGATFIRDLLPGEVVVIDGNQISSFFYAQRTSSNLCAMEFVYFARPDSFMDEISIHKSREKCGRILAQESSIQGDVVIGVPDSSLSAAMGYASESGIDYEMGLIKNRYIGRTFIQPSQALREKGVLMKLSTIPEVIKGKDIILIDDSLVRGTTIKRIVVLLKESGAKSIHVKIASPQIKFPCFYGVDISTSDELIASKMDDEQLREYIGADSLSFLSLDGLMASINEDKKYCEACFTGNYVTDIY